MRKKIEKQLSPSALIAAAILSFAPTGLVGATPDIVQKLAAHTNAIRAVAVSPDGRLIASGGLDKAIKVFSRNGMGLVHTIAEPGVSIADLEFSPDGTLLASAYFDTVVRLWRTNDGRLQRVWGNRMDGFDPQGATSLSFSPDGTLLAGATAVEFGGVTLTRVSDGVLIKAFPGCGSGYHSIAFSPLGTCIAASCIGTAAVSIWNMETFQPTHVIGNSTPVIVFSTSGEVLAAGGTLSYGGIVPAAIGLWHAADRALMRQLPGHSEGVASLAFSLDGLTLLSAGENGSIHFWRVADGVLLKTYDQETTGVTSLAITPDGRQFAYGRTDGVLVLAWMPLWVSRLTRSTTQFEAAWQGGSGRYQVQTRTNISSGNWQNQGSPTTATNTFIPLDGSEIYLRVQSLPDA